MLCFVGSRVIIKYSKYLCAGDNMFSNVKEYMEKLVSERGLPFLDVVCCREGREIFRHTAGDADGKELLYMFSCSKPITVTAVMMLYERGMLSLDDEVEKYLPAYGNISVSDGDGVRPCRNKLTIRHLLTMSGGLDYNYFRGGVREVLEKNPNAETEEIINAYTREPMLFEPGDRFSYSLCHDVLAAIIEKVSGSRFSKFIEENIFLPLGMTDSSFDNIPKREMAKAYKCTDDGIAPSRGVVPPSPRYESGGSGLISSVNDYIKFASMLALGGVSVDKVRILKEETVELIRSEQISSVTVNNNFTCVQGSAYSYGLGVRTRKTATDWGLPVGEFGWDGAAGSYLLVDPERKISIVMGMHVEVWPKCFMGEHLNIVKEIYKNL